MRITAIDIIPLRLPVKNILVESGGSFDRFDHVVLKVNDESGLFGLGEVEAYPSFERPGSATQAGIVSLLQDYLVPVVIGEDPFNFNAIWQKMDKAVVGFPRIKGGIDNALYDLVGKALDVPAYNLLGGKLRDDYVVEGVGYGISVDEPEKVAQVALAAVRAGYQQIELKAGSFDPWQDVERLRCVRAAIGKEIPIKIDFNGFLSPKTAISVIREMERSGIQWIEQPTKYWDIEGLAMVRDAVNTTIVVDEAVETPHDMMRIVKARAADAVHVKPTIKGGLTNARKIAEIATSAGMEVIAGTSAPTGVGMAAAHAFIAACPNMSGGTHGSPSDVLVEDIVTEPIPAGSTLLRVSDRPGLGVELDREVVEKYRQPYTANCLGEGA